MPLTLTIARRSRWSRWLVDNPLFTREVRRRMRGRIFSWSLIFYIVVLGLVSCLLMIVNYPMMIDTRDTRQILQSVNQIGRVLFVGMISIEAFVALLMAPLLTAGVANQEKERDTFDFLRVTTLSSTTFVVGCLLTTAALLLLVISCTLPVIGLSFIFGGVSLSQVLWQNLLLFCAGMAIASWGVFNTTGALRARRVRLASFVVLIIVFAYLAPLGIRIFFAPAGISGGFAFFGPSRTLILCGFLLLLMIVMAIASARRLYEPNNRLFAYWQYTVFCLILFALLPSRLFMPQPNPLDAEGVRLVLVIMHFTGFALLLVALLLFSTGRVERGDEVWRIRLRHPIFQRLDERWLFYPLLVALWLAGVGAAARIHPLGGTFRQDFFLTLPVMLLALWNALAISMLVSLVSPDRNRAAVGAALILLMLWGVLPAFALAGREISTSLNAASASTISTASDWILDVSPITQLLRIADSSPMINLERCLVFLLLLCLLLTAPLLTRKARSRFAVDYD